MKTFLKLLILVFVLITACSDDDKELKLSSRELLIKYDWIVFRVQPDISGEMPEPDPIFTVLNFSETTYSGSNYLGNFYELGDWSLDGDILNLSEGPAQIIELTEKKLIYEAPDGTTITRLPIAEVTGI